VQIIYGVSIHHSSLKLIALLHQVKNLLNPLIQGLTNSQGDIDSTALAIDDPVEMGLGKLSLTSQFRLCFAAGADAIQNVVLDSKIDHFVN
jgi:hypothetical protein